MGFLTKMASWIHRGRMSYGDMAYQKAVAVSEDVIQRMREASNSNDPARAVMADLWHQRHNVPFMVTIVEAIEEMKSPVRQSPYDL